MPSILSRISYRKYKLQKILSKAKQNFQNSAG